MEDFQQLVEQAKKDLLNLYLDESDERDWAVAWSGGKDSTCVMGLVVSMLESLPPEQRKRRIHAVMSDTVMENPILEAYMHDQVEKLNTYVAKTNLPISAQLVMRELEQSYFYLILGRGYFLPQNNGAGRWCTDRLKLRPQNEKLKEINPSYILIGVRSSESAKRKQSIEKWSNNEVPDYKIGDHVNLKKSKTFMPIVDFTIEDVWEFLSKERLPWSSSHAVRTLYREATGECGFKNPKETEKKASKSETCGARFGCWTCAPVSSDRSTEQMSIHHSWMTPLSVWRTLQVKVFGDYKPQKPNGQTRKERSAILKQFEDINKEIKRITKSGHKRNGKRMVDKSGSLRDDQGTFTVEGREFLLNKLLETEIEVNKLRKQHGLPNLKLISDEEIHMIREQWKIDREHYPHLITNVSGIPISRLKELLRQMDEIEKNQVSTRN